MTRPKSATAAMTGVAGLAGFALALAALVNSSWPVHGRALAALAATAIAMIAVDTLYFRTYRNDSTGLGPVKLKPLQVERILRKLIGLIATLAILAAVYWILPEYRREFYAPYWAALYVIVPVMLATAPSYIAFVDQRQVEPEDAYAEIGAFILSGVLPQKYSQLRHHVLGWTVKGFFLPLMFVHTCSMLSAVLTILEQGPSFDFMRLHGFAIDLMFTIDVLVAVLGYSLTLRVLDSHIRSVEPTVLGWLVCLACYEPVNRATGAYLDYETGSNWIQAFAAWPALQIIWGLVIFVCLLIYTWATVSFGLRFSNLTHRGVITDGPYRWMKHPAYVSKNLSWWLVSMPFLTTASPGEALRHSVLLLGVNVIYVLRAITEERHLSRDPDYAAYSSFIAENGAFAQIKRQLRPKAPAAEDASGFPRS
jgi:protein-S-isoprenylcysteine O-methyltransferase Ste14